MVGMAKQDVAGPRFELSTVELREWLKEIELQAQDAWTNAELSELRRTRDSIVAELEDRGAP